MGVNCEFLQSEDYTLNEQKCLQEIAEKKSEFTNQGKTVEAICIDIDIKLERKSNEPDRQLLVTRTN
jgi:hypothetical protein